MRKLLSSVSEEALFYKESKAQSKIPDGWDVKGFKNEHVYIREVEIEEKRYVWRHVPGELLDWDKIWYGVFSVQTGTARGVADSIKKLRTQLKLTGMVEVFLN